MIKVVNTRDTLIGEYIGRGSPLGNPFPMKNHSEAERMRVINQYRSYIAEKIKNKDTAICNELRRLYKMAKQGNLFLRCWCAPKACHGDIIKQILEKYL